MLSDEEAAPAATAKVIRRITWVAPDTGEEWQFLTSEPERSEDSRRQMTPPALIVLIYRHIGPYKISIGKHAKAAINSFSSEDIVSLLYFIER